MWFLFFIVIHVTLGVHDRALRNLNHIYAGRDDDGWVGFWIFAASMVVMVVGWVAATPFTLATPGWCSGSGYALIGPLQRLFEHVEPKPGAVHARRTSRRTSGTTAPTRTPMSTKRCSTSDFVDWRLQIYGLVEHPVELSLAELRALPYHEQITQHFCIQGWSGVAKWGGVSMQTIMDMVKPAARGEMGGRSTPSAKGPTSGIYYDAHRSST